MATRLKEFNEEIELQSCFAFAAPDNVMLVHLPVYNHVRLQVLDFEGQESTCEFCKSRGQGYRPCARP